MRRMIRNTTAIAACLSLLAPQLVQARAFALDIVPAGQGGTDGLPLILAQAEVPLLPADAEEQEAPSEEAGSESPMAEEPVPDDQPAADEAAAQDPEPAEPAASEEPAAPETAAEPDAEAVPETAAEPEPAPVEEIAEEPAQPEAALEPEAPAAEPAPEIAPPAEDEVSEPVDAAVEAEAEAAPIEEPAPAPEAAPADAEVGSERPVEAAREQQTERPVARDDAAAAEASAPDQATNAEAGGQTAADAAKTTAPDENALRDALAREEQADPAAPAANEPAESPAGADTAGQDTPAEETADQETALDADAQDADARPAEADAPVTEASRQAAEETSASTAAAALDDTTQGEVVEQKITEENSRSSAEDFETSLRDALQPQEQAEAAPRAEDDDDNNDLARALLLGLGAVAVGTYLNNNRQVALSAPDRVVVTMPDGSQQLIKDDTALLRQPGSTVTTENFDDGSSRTIVIRPDGSRVVTIRDADLRVLRRTLVSADGTQTRLIDDTAAVEPVDVSALPTPAPSYGAGIYQDEAALRDALQRETGVNRAFTLSQIRNIAEVRALVPPITIDSITFETGSAAITPDQARQLSTLGNAIRDSITRNPREMFLIEGHTDTVGSDAANLALSDRRAESVALALTEYFDVPPENMVVQGYGESFLRVRQEGDVRDNRRAAVRRITELLQTAAAR